MKLFVATAATMFLASSAFAGTTNFLTQSRAGTTADDGLASNDQGAGQSSPARAADDFTVADAGGWTNLSFTFELAQVQDVFENFSLELYADNGGRPADTPMMRLDGAASVTDTGNQSFGSPVYEIVFELGSMVLDQGTYWFSPVGVNTSDLPNRITSQAIFATSNNGAPAHFRSEHFGFADWTSTPDLIGTAVDLNVIIDGTLVPAPGAVALLGLAGFAARRRRRA